MEETFDVVVIGAGPAGENVVDRAVRGGLSAAIVESELAGGECSYWACIPSKALLRPVELHAAAERVPGLSVGRIDAAAVLARRDEAVSNYDDGGQAKWIASVPATLVRGKARLDGPKRVAVGDRVLVARHAVVLGTGTGALIPDVPGLAEAKPWTNREATGVKSVPRRLVVLGGGVVACEMGQALHALGATETTLLVRGGSLLPRNEPFAGEAVEKALRESGIDVRLRADVTRVERPVEGGPVTVHLGDGSTVEADEILVATGRTPNTTGIGLPSVGLPEGKYVEVDDSLRAKDVPEGWLYVVGDANGRNLLTHMGKYQARVCGDVIVARARGDKEDDGPWSSLRAGADGRGAPQVVFTDPQVAAAGLTAAQARERGHTIRVVEYELPSVSGAYLRADGPGKASAVVDEDRRVLLGVTFVGSEVAELLHAGTVAVTAEVPLERLWHAVPSYPTVSEVWLRLLEAYGL
ncbi:dihydrolipoyl dehydrogenase family protein [Virgisporangium aliadipatigenens]|uniref:dihydrolipoyl dehydrogenase family protein n=1 Tax=Virgisporangium aliadipatigenens TaxID=741659 RepID=UPI001943F05E|nr:NAD(P)/FAD-dependent oxidoreductase [Virgisporangium aliadipatigenens]